MLCRPFLILLLLNLFINKGQGQLIIHTVQDGEILIYEREGFRFRIIDTLIIKANVPQILHLNDSTWIVSIVDRKAPYSNFIDRFDFVLEDRQQIVQLKFPINETKIINSLINDSILLFTQTLKPIELRRDYSAQKQLDAFMQKNMSEYARWTDSIKVAENEMGMMASIQISKYPYSRVSQFAFGIYCYHMPEDSFYSNYLNLSLAENLSRLPKKQIEEFNNRIESRVGMPLPKDDFKTINGKIVNPGLANGKIRILYFTSSTCGPCKLLKPELEKLSTDTQFKEVEFISISLEFNNAGIDAALADAKRTKAPWHQIVKDQREGPFIKTFMGGFPSLIISDKNAIIKRRIIGYTDTTISEIKEALNNLLPN